MQYTINYKEVILTIGDSKGQVMSPNDMLDVFSHIIDGDKEFDPTQ